MKKVNLTIFLFLLLLTVKAQNMVLNGDFEQYSTCPYAPSQLHLAILWINPTNATPDYLNECSTSLWATIPANNYGYQQARSGTGYGGFVLYESISGMGTNYREYVETSLSVSMTAGTCYHFEMYVSAAHLRYSTCDIAVYFSDVGYVGINNTTPLPFIPQISNATTNFPDTLNWMLISGDYLATGGENYIIIGNFNDDATTDTLVSNNASPDASAYCYIDDISVTPTICTGIDEFTVSDLEITVYPNPVEDNFELRISNFEWNKKYELKIFDIIGNKVLQSSILNPQFTINISFLQSGIYFIEINNVRKKFLKN